MARSFNGTNQMMVHNSALATVPPLTLACWFKSNSNSDGSLICLNRSANQDSHIRLEINSSARVRAYSYNGSTDGSALSSSIITTGVWQHGCAVFYANNSRAAFLNGSNKGTNSTNVNVTSLGETVIGARRAAVGYGIFFSGLIALPAIWNAALTDDEIASLAMGFRPDQIRPQSLVSFNLFDPRILDVCGNVWNNNGSTDSFDQPLIK